MNDLFKRTDPENNIAGFVKRTPTIRDALTWPEWFHPLEQLSIWFPDLRLYEWQRDAIRAACEPFSRVYLSTCNECQPVDTIIPTPCGPTRFGDLYPGALVFGGDGEKAHVTAITQPKTMPVVRITFDNGEASTLCSMNHKWRYISADRRFRNRNRNVPETLTTEDIILKQGQYASPLNRGAVLAAEAAQYTERHHLIDPYTMGLLLGNGCFRKGAGYSTRDPETLAHIREHLPAGLSLKPNGEDWRITATSGATSLYSDELRRLLLYGHKSEAKFVPTEYKHDSVRHRLAVLRGLMDTDGTIGESNGIEYSTTSFQLAVDVAWLVRSLGGKSRIAMRFTNFTYKGQKKSGQMSYRVTAYLSVCPFLLERKARKWKPNSKTMNRVVTAIEEQGEAECISITVDSPDHTYLTNDFIRTCNSGKTSVLLPLFGLAHMIAYPGCAVYSTSASEDQVKVQLFQNNLAHIMSRYPTWKLSTSAMTLESTPIDGLVSRWIGYKCIKGGKAEGYHGQWKRGKSKRWHYCPCIYMVDEGKSVEDELWESITRIDPDRLLAVSSPGEENGEFFRRLDPNTIDVAPTEQTTEDMSDAELESRIKMLEERERIVRAMRGDS